MKIARILFLSTIVLYPAASKCDVVAFANCTRATEASGTVDAPSSDFSSAAIPNGLFQYTNQASHVDSDYAITDYADEISDVTESGGVLAVAGTGNCSGTLIFGSSRDAFALIQSSLSVDFTITSACQFSNSWNLSQDLSGSQPAGQSDKTEYSLTSTSGATIFLYGISPVTVGQTAAPLSGSSTGTLAPGKYHLTAGCIFQSAYPMPSNYSSYDNSGHYDVAFSVWPISVPGLAIRAISSHQAQVSWSTNFAGYSLQTALEPSGGAWQAVTNPVVTVGSSNVVTVTTSGAAQFFRLSGS